MIPTDKYKKQTEMLAVGMLSFAASTTVRITSPGIASDAHKTRCYLVTRVPTRCILWARYS